MGDLVDDGDLDLPLQLGQALAHLLQWFLKDEDRIRMKLRSVEEGALLKRSPVIEAEELLVRGIPHLLQHLPRGAFLHGQDDVLHPPPDLRRDTAVRPSYRPVELLPVEFHESTATQVIRCPALRFETEPLSL